MAFRTEIAVIGGGVIGLACAWRLAQRGLQASVFERSTCGSGASLASLGVLAPHGAGQTEPFHRLHRDALDLCEYFCREAADESGLPVPYARCGALKPLSTGIHVRAALDEIESARQKWESPAVAGSLRLLSAEEAAFLQTPGSSF